MTAVRVSGDDIIGLRTEGELITRCDTAKRADLWTTGLTPSIRGPADDTITACFVETSRMAEEKISISRSLSSARETQAVASGAASASCMKLVLPSARTSFWFRVCRRTQHDFSISTNTFKMRCSFSRIMNGVMIQAKITTIVNWERRSTELMVTNKKQQTEDNRCMSGFANGLYLIAVRQGMHETWMLCLKILTQNPMRESPCTRAMR